MPSFSLFSCLLAIPLLYYPLAARAQSCNATSPCTADAPCCSEFGFCGSGPGYCLGGCDALYSFALDSCTPEPMCQSASYKFTTPDMLANVSTYEGNASTAAWTLDKGSALATSDGPLALILTEDNGGTRISSTHYVHYGTISARFKSAKWAGVVAAFILMSDVHDEIDVELPGNDTLHYQSNFYWLGVANYTHGATHPVSTDTFDNFHTYTIDWQADQLTWSVDGQVSRTVTKASTIDPSTGIATYPSTPARVQLSIWPAGINTSAPGTIEWSGGMINWEDPDYIAAGNFYILLDSVNISCTPPAAGTPTDADAYSYGPNVSGIPAVLLSNSSTIYGAAGPRADARAGAAWRTLSALVGAGVLALGAGLI